MSNVPTFHVWKSAQYAGRDQIEATSSTAQKRKSSTTRACEPCRRRKVRCNGEHPCEACQWYKKAASCHYTESRPRQLISRNSVDEISVTLQDYKRIIQRLFPTSSPDELKELSRESLIGLFLKNRSLQHQAPSPADEKPPTASPDSANLEQLQPMPEDGADATESKSSDIQGVTDDINALSLSVKKSSSYLGISSVVAVLRVILWLDPEAQDFFTKDSDNSYLDDQSFSEDWDQQHPAATDESSAAWNEIPLINAYFNYVHPFVPLIDEQPFRDTYVTRKRTDAKWLLLLNTVLAMGGMAGATSCEDMSHILYWNRAKQYLTIETLESVQIESVQALALLGGYYLHYLNKPNMANALMGATLRLATALGLHRDYSEGVGPANTEKAGYTIEVRRRIWWNIFIMDAWHGAALGRPSMGRMGHAISAKPPQEPIGQSQALLAIVQENIRFCLISTKMEDALAVSPLIVEDERRSLDQSLVEWFKTSSVQVGSPHSRAKEPHGVTIAKNVMRWRYLLWRIIIHRPVFLWYAMRRMPFAELPQDKKSAIQLCRELAGELINDIAKSWEGQIACQMAGWNATWNLYQTLMVPLLSLFSDRSDAVVVEKARAQIEQGLAALTDLRNWSNIARRSYDVVNRIYEASKRHSPAAEQVLAGNSEGFVQQGLAPASNQTAFGNFQANFYGDYPNMASHEMMAEDMFDSLNWSTALGGDDTYPFDASSFGWGYNAMNGWSTNESYGIPVFMDDESVNNMQQMSSNPGDSGVEANAGSTGDVGPAPSRTKYPYLP